MAQDGEMDLPEEDAAEDESAPKSEEYQLMLTLERIETLREELEETGYSSLQEVEGALAMTDPSRTLLAGGNGVNMPQVVGNVDRDRLATIRNDMLELGVANVEEINGVINDLNARLDSLDENSEKEG